MDSINWEGQKMEISTKIFWCRDVHVFFCKKSTKPSLFVLSGDNLVQDMTYWGLEGDVQGLTLEINHTHICADFSLNKFSSMKLFMCNCI